MSLLLDLVHVLDLLIVCRLLLESESIDLRGEHADLVSELLHLPLVLHLHVALVQLDDVPVLPQIGRLTKQLCAPALILIDITSQLSNEVPVPSVLRLGEQRLVLEGEFLQLLPVLVLQVLDLLLRL